MIKDGVLTYKLLEHQKEAVVNNDRNFTKHRVSGVVMPTGTGKTFVALAHMISINNPNYKGVDEDGNIVIPIGPDGVVNDSKILYVAPTNEIAEQIKIDIVEYICGIDLDELYKNEKETMTKDEFNKFKVKKRDEIVRKVFPNLEFKCYHTLAAGVRNHEEGKEGYDPYLDSPDFVILDEAHRSGAPTFEQGVAALLGGNVIDGEVVRDESPEVRKIKDKIKVLPISATPERDVDGKDMTKVWAKAFGDYTEEELADDVRADLGMRMTLPDAIKRGILRDPNVVRYDCNLVFTDDYQMLVKQAKDDNPYVSIRAEARKALEVINREVIGIENYHLLNKTEQEAALKEKEIEIMTQAIKDGLFNIHGKFALFAPHNSNGGSSTKEERKKFLEDHANRTIDILKEALKRAGVENEILVDYISSDYTDSDNAKVLTAFNDKDPSKGPIHIVVAQEKFNEGVHAKKISGGFNTRKITEQENTKLRAQSILFLQQKGRFDHAIIPGVPLSDKPTIFDVCNNFYIQNTNGAVDPEQRIPIFELTEKQKMLHDAYSKIRNMLPEKSDIRDILSRYMQIADILSKYKIPLNCKTIESNTKLLKLLSSEEYSDKKDKVLEELYSLGLIEKKGSKYVDYNIGKILAKARKSYWSGIKEFGKYSVSELIENGVIDKNSKEYQNALDKGYVDERGFFLMKVPRNHLYHNVNTGTLFNRKNKDVDGFMEGQFNEEGLDEQGFNRRGFNDQGIHRETGTIHDIRGFMADGTNILTGTKFDVNGFNWDGIKPFYDIEKKLVGGFDRDHFFHTYDSELEEFSKIRAGLYAPYQKGVNVDYYGFNSRTKRNVFNNNSYTTPNGFYPDRKNDKGSEYDSYGRDIDNCNRFGFNLFDVHKDTGTRLDTKGFTKDDYSPIAIVTKDERSKYKSTPNSNKPFVQNIADATESNSIKRAILDFNEDGTNKVTGKYTDIYGFTLLDYKEKNPNSKIFYPHTLRFIHKASITKNAIQTLYHEQPINVEPKKVKINIFGTDNTGHCVDKRTGKKTLHPSLVVAKDFIEKCIKGEMTEEEYLKEYAIKNKLLLYNPNPNRQSEAKYALQTHLTTAFELYRLCGSLSKSDSVKTIFDNANQDKVNKYLVPNISNCKDKSKEDCKILRNARQKLQSIIESGKDKDGKISKILNTINNKINESDMLDDIIK